MQNYTSKNRLSQKFGVKNYSEDRTSVEVVGRIGVNTDSAVQNLDIRGTAYISNDVGIGTTIPNDVVTESNTSKLAVGIVSAFEYYGDGSNLTNITNVAFADSLDKTSQGQLLYQEGNKITSLLEYGNSGQLLQSQGNDQPPQWANAAPAGAVEGFLLRDEGVQVGGGQTFSELNFVGAAVSVFGTSFGGIATVTVNQEFAKVAGFASDSRVAGVASDAERVRVSDFGDNVQVFIPFSTESSGLTTFLTNQNLTFNPNSGLLTATKFSGIGSDITDLNASELKFGTIPDNVFPDTLPADVVVGFAATAGIATTSIIAGVANTANILNLENESTDTENFITFARQATGEQELKTNTNLTFNSNTGQLTATSFSGDGNGLTNLNIGTIDFATKAGTATSAEGLTTARNIFGIPFDGTSNIDASNSSLNVQGEIINVANITGKDSNITIQPLDSTVSRDIIIRGNDNTSANQSGGNVIIGDSGRGEIRFLSAVTNGIQFFKPGDSNISANLDTSQLTNQDQNFTFPNKSGTFALIDDILNGQIAGRAATLEVDSTTDDNDYQLTFIELNQSGLSTDFFSNNNIQYNPSKNQLTLANNGDFVGVGSLLTVLDASNIDIGTLNTQRLPNFQNFQSSYQVNAVGNSSNIKLICGKNFTFEAGKDNTGLDGGQLLFQGNRGEFSYKFFRPGMTPFFAALDCTKILDQEIEGGATQGSVYFTLPGDKTGLGNTFAMLDDITNGTAGTAETAERVVVQTRNNNDIDYTILFSQGAGESQNIFNSGSNFTYNASTDILTAPKFAGIGSLLTQLDAGQIDRGTLNTLRLPSQYRLNANITIDANGSGSDLNLDAGRNIRITPGIDQAGGQIIMEANNGDESYKFRNPNDYNSNNKRTAAIDCTKVLDGDTSGVVVFTLPGDKTGTGNTFAMLDDITGVDGSGGVVAASAKKFDDDTVINFTNDVDGQISFDGSESGPISVAVNVTGGDVDFADVAGVSTNAKIDDISNGSNQNLYLTFVDQDGDGNRQLKIDNDLQYNQATELLFTDISGSSAFSTNSTNTKNVEIVNFNFSGATGSNDYTVYFGGPATGNQRLRKDDDFNYHTVSQILFVPQINASGIITAQDFNSTSDRKLKTNIERISDPIEKILKIDGVSFNWIKNDKPSLGVIADDIEKVLPELVSNSDPKTVNYNGLIGLLIEAVKDQQNEINSLKERLSKLE